MQRRLVLIAVIATLVLCFAFNSRTRYASVRIEAQARPFVDHPRLFLTPAKKSELIARMRANTSDYQLFKASADSLVVDKPWLTVNSELAQTLDTTATSITVVDGSVFPTGSFQIRVNTELITIASRSGNILIVSPAGRGETTNVGWPTVAIRHVRGSTVWQHVNGLSHIETPPMLALLVQMGVPGYELRARAAVTARNLRATGRGSLDASSPAGGSPCLSS